HYISSLPPDVRQRKRQRTITSGCAAEYTIWKLIDQPYYRVRLNGDHSAHAPDAPEEQRLMRPSSILKQHVFLAVVDGVPWKRYREVNLPTDDDMDDIDDAWEAGSLDRLALSYRLTSGVFYNARRHRIYECRADADPIRSVVKHGATFTAAGASFLFLRNQRLSDGRETFSVFYMSKFTKKLLARHGGRLVSMDGTHDICLGFCGKKCIMISLVIKNVVTGKGCPVAEIHETFLRWVQAQVPSFYPNQIMMDCSATEVRAVSNVFPSAYIFFCVWHFARAVQVHIKSKLTDDELRTWAADTVNGMIWTYSHEEFRRLCAVFRSRLAGTDFLAYFEKQWMAEDVVQRWAGPWAATTWQDSRTNNYHEAFHARLKSVELDGSRPPRIDAVLFILHRMARKYRFEHQQCTLNIVPRSLDKAEQRRLDLANEVPDAYLPLVVAQSPDGGLWVRSQDLRQAYLIRRNVDGLLVGCSCPDHCAHDLPCKHMHLASRQVGCNIAYSGTSYSLSPPLPTANFAAPAAAAIGRVQRQEEETERTMLDGLADLEATKQIFQRGIEKGRWDGFSSLPGGRFATAADSLSTARTVAKTAYRSYGQPQRS
ncbi:hypothetical protein JCM11641_003309, partial [Rhodosporidiobolus odoratus]